MRHDSWQPFSYPAQARTVKFLLSAYYVTQHQKLGDRCLWDMHRRRPAVMSRHLVTEFLEQVYLVRVWYPREREQEQEYPTHPRGPSAVGSIKTFLLRVESRRPSQRQFARRALQSENQGTKAMQPPTTTEMGHPLSRGGKIMSENGGKARGQKWPIKR
ncbi:hypothetical protein AB3S75_014704 [Citrus x aurantiifolia]